MTDWGSGARILQLLETPGVGPARVKALIVEAEHERVDLAEFLADRNALTRVLTPAQVEKLVEGEERVAELVRRLGTLRASLVAFTDGGYPRAVSERLDKGAPPLLVVLGNTKLLEKLSVGFCGSRKASEKGIATARDCAEQMARHGINVVSGYAFGVDLATHRAALLAGGTTTLVLAEGILHFRVKKEIEPVWDWERALVVSEFLPGVPWSAHNAMQRNRTICALSRAMVLIEAGSKGGSIEAGRTCLKLGIPLFAPVYGGMPPEATGNRDLLAQGARPLMKIRSTNRANLAPLFGMFQEPGLSDEEQGRHSGATPNRIAMVAAPKPR